MVEDHALDLAAPCGHGHVHGGRHEFGAHVISQSKAENATRADVFDVGHVEPTLLGRHVGDIAAGSFAGSPDGEVPFDQVGQGRGAQVGDGGAALLAPAVFGKDAVDRHQTLDGLWLTQ